MAREIEALEGTSKAQGINNQKGVTLVELLAVLVIIGIVSTIAVPKIGNIIQDSRDKATVNEAINIIHAAKLAYIGDNEVFDKENSIKVTELVTLGYIQVDGYDGEVVMKDSEGWYLTTNSKIQTAVNNLVANDNYIAGADLLSKEILLEALEGKEVNR